ncbi:MAG: alpha/beta hydrolase [Gemmatimonadaceae bacterium]
MKARAVLSIFLILPLCFACFLGGGSSTKSPGVPVPSLKMENVAFHSGSGGTIRAWFVRGARGAGAVLLLHGAGSDRKSMSGRAAFLHALGFTVLAPDLQGNGESPGDHVTYGVRESLDASAAMDFLHTEMPGERVGVIGVSMGGAASVLGSGPLPADAFVLESVYPTIRQALSDRLATWFGPLGFAGRWLTSPVISILGSEIGVTEDELKPIDRIGEVHVPLLMIAGTADRYTPLVEAESLFAHARGTKSFWAVDGASHEDIHAYQPLEYERRVGSFLERYLRAAQPQ